MARVNSLSVQHDLNINGAALAKSPATSGIADAASLGPALAFEVRSWRDFDRADRIIEWDALARLAAEPNPFFESWSLLPALASFDPDENVKLVALRAEGQLVGLVPLRRDSNYYAHPIPHWRVWTHHNCFLCAPLVAKGFEHAFWQHLLGWVDKNAWFAGFLHISHMPAESCLTQALADITDLQSRPAATVQREERALLASEAEPEDYLQTSLSTKKRKELRRQRRRLEELGTLATARQHGTVGLQAWVDTFLKLEHRSWKGSAGSAIANDALTETAFRKAIEGAAERGRLERLALTLDGKPIAMLATFLTAPGAFSFKTAFDEDFSRFSPGVLLQIENLDLLARDRIRWCDSCAAEDHPMIDHIWRERRTIARYSIAIGGALRRRAFVSLIKQEMGHAPDGIATGAAA